MQTSKMCPLLERGDPRCAQRLSLEGLPEAFHYCAGDYANCTVYHEIRAEHDTRSEELPEACSV